MFFLEFVDLEVGVMDDRDRPTTNQPLNAPGPRPKVTPFLAVIGMILVIAAIFVVISLLRYNT